MPERWERELDELRHMEMRETAIRERIERGPSADRGPSRRNALLAGIVAGAVVIAGIGALWQLDRDLARIGGDAADLPVLSVRFERNGLVLDEPDQQIPRVDTTIVYGDAREESFTSTTPPGALVDYVSVEQVTRFQPGPTEGSAIEFTADGQDPRVLIGNPLDWPDFERFERIEALPSTPGKYVLVFEATYDEGVARTARTVRIVEPGAVQLVASGREGLDGATASAYLDGRRTDGFLSMSWLMGGDVGGQSEPVAPTFEEGRSLRIPSGTPLLLGFEATEAHAGLFESYDDFNLNESLPIDLSSADGSVEGEPGRHLLAMDVSWRNGMTGYGQDGTAERAVFFFPVEIVTEQEPSPAPAETPTPDPGVPRVVTVDIRRSSEETGDPEATARLGDQEVWMCPDGWTVVNPDGTEDSVIFDCGQSDVFQAPVGTPIEVTGDFATLNVSAGVTGNRLPGTGEAVPPLEPGTIITLGYDVTWEDGSEASFWLLLTVEDTETAPEEPGIVVWIYGLGERSTEVPIITMTYGGKTRRGCTEGFQWTLPDGTRVDEASGRHGSILPQCSYEPLFTVPPGVPITLEVPTATEVFATRTMTPFYGGRDGFGASVRWPGGGEGDFTVTFEVAGAPSDRDIELDCAEEDRIAFTTPDGPRILPGGSAYIRGNLEGFQQTDVIEQMTREQGGSTEWDGTWQVVRGGSVIAAVEFGSLRGVACRGSGIGGM